MTDRTRRSWLLFCLSPGLLISFVVFAVSGSPFGVAGIGLCMVSMVALLNMWEPKDDPALSDAPPLEPGEDQAHITMPNGSYVIAFDGRTEQATFRYPKRDAARIARLLRMTAGYIESTEETGSYERQITG